MISTRNSLPLPVAAILAGAAMLLATAVQAQQTAPGSVERPAPSLLAAHTAPLAPQQPIAASPAPPQPARCVPGSMAAIMSAKLPPSARPERLGHACP